MTTISEIDAEIRRLQQLKVEKQYENRLNEIVERIEKTPITFEGHRVIVNINLTIENTPNRWEELYFILTPKIKNDLINFTHNLSIEDCIRMNNDFLFLNPPPNLLPLSALEQQLIFEEEVIDDDHIDEDNFLETTKENVTRIRTTTV